MVVGLDMFIGEQPMSLLQFVVLLPSQVDIVLIGLEPGLQFVAAVLPAGGLLDLQAKGVVESLYLLQVLWLLLLQQLYLVGMFLEHIVESFDFLTQHQHLVLVVGYFVGLEVGGIVGSTPIVFHVVVETPYFGLCLPLIDSEVVLRRVEFLRAAPQVGTAPFNLLAEQGNPAFVLGYLPVGVGQFSDGPSQFFVLLIEGSQFLLEGSPVVLVLAKVALQFPVSPLDGLVFVFIFPEFAVKV